MYAGPSVDPANGQQQLAFVLGYFDANHCFPIAYTGIENKEFIQGGSPIDRFRAIESSKSLVSQDNQANKSMAQNHKCNVDNHQQTQFWSKRNLFRCAIGPLTNLEALERDEHSKV